MPATAAGAAGSPRALPMVLMLALGLLPGCTWIAHLGTDMTGSELGRTYYVGGAGPFGHLGTIDVPKGLRQAGYRGSIEVFGWQSLLGGTLRDQMDRERNEYQARRLAQHIDAYLRRHRGRRVNIIALSAGTGVATWALEALPADRHVGTVVFLASSLSREYDLTPALRHIDDRLYNFFSPNDPLLRFALPVAGSVDRETHSPSIAGLLGFQRPADPSAAALYADRLRERPYRREYERYGYRGLHADVTSVEFVRHVIAPLLMRPVAAPEPTDAPEAPPPPDTAPDASGIDWLTPAPANG